MLALLTCSLYISQAMDQKCYMSLLLFQCGTYICGAVGYSYVKEQLLLILSDFPAHDSTHAPYGHTGDQAVAFFLPFMIFIVPKSIHARVVRLITGTVHPHTIFTKTLSCMNITTFSPSYTRHVGPTSLKL